MSGEGNHSEGDFLRRFIGGTAKAYALRVTLFFVGLGVALIVVNEELLPGALLVGLGVTGSAIVLVWKP